jgi:hypothetical protein
MFLDVHNGSLLCFEEKKMVKGLGHSPGHKGAKLRAAENNDDDCPDISIIDHIEAISHKVVVNRFFSILTAGGEIVCQIKRGCKLTCGAPHPPLSGSPCLLIVMLITLLLLLFSANSSHGGIFVQSI